MRPKCEATTKPKCYWDSKKISFPNCSRFASINIDGINLCVQHASSIAIVKLLAEGRCKQIGNSPALCIIDDRWRNNIK